MDDSVAGSAAQARKRRLNRLAHHMLRAPVLWLLSAIVAAQAAPSYPPAFPRPNANRLFDTDRVAVWDVVWPNGQPSPMHRHVFDQVGTYYARGGRRITTPDGVARETTTELGSLSTTR